MKMYLHKWGSEMKRMREIELSENYDEGGCHLTFRRCHKKRKS